MAADTGAGTLSAQNYNASDIDFPGSVFRLQNQSNVGSVSARPSITFALNLLSEQNLVLTFLTDRTNEGFNSDQVSYSSNGGATFTPFGSPYNPTSNGAGNFNGSDPADNQSFDFSSILALNNNPNVQVRITFGYSGSVPNGQGGQNRFDNIVFNADPQSGSWRYYQSAGSSPVPEPTSLLLFGFAFSVASGFAWRRRKATSV